MELDQKPQDHRMSPQVHGGGTSVIVWLIASFVVSIAVSFAAGHAPARIRLIGLFPIMFGSAIGWIVPWLARELNADPSRRLLSRTAFLLAFAGWITVTAETFRQEELRRVKLPSNGLAAQMMKDFERQVKGTDLEIPRPTLLTSFRTHLSRRIQQIGDWTSPWPECFVIGELIAASIAAVLISRRVDQK